jgi:hypothetical protein
MGEDLAEEDDLSDFGSLLFFKSEHSPDSALIRLQGYSPLLSRIGRYLLFCSLKLHC